MLAQTPRRRALVAALAGASLAALGITAASSHATALRPAAPAASPIELLVSNFNTPAGTWAPLRRGATYRASTFPLGLQLKAPDGSWSGAQWKVSSHAKPAFGFVELGQGPLAGPRGLIAIVTAFGPTPSITATIARLRTGGSGVTYHATTPASVAGFSGKQFDGEVFGRWGHVLVPFSAVTSGASPPDNYRLEKGEVFRIVALGVRGKTVVLILENWKLPAEQFPAFLASARRLLATLTFPAS